MPRMWQIVPKSDCKRKSEALTKKIVYSRLKRKAQWIASRIEHYFAGLVGSPRLLRRHSVICRHAKHSLGVGKSLDICFSSVRYPK